MRKTFRASISLFKVKAAEGLQYRLAAFSGATVSVFFALIEVVILTVFFKYGKHSGESINGLSLTQGVSYIWLGQLFVMLQIPAIDGDLMGKIVNGDIGVELCRPLDLYVHWYVRSAAGKVNAFFLRGGMVVLCGVVLFMAGFKNVGLGFAVSPVNFALFILSVVCAFFFSTAYGMFVTSIRIGIAWGDGPINLITVLGMVLSGSFLPLQLWPDFMQGFLRIQPFASYLDVPAKLYVGSITITDGIIGVILQVFWIGVFVFFGRMLMKRKLKAVVIQGG